MENHKKATMKDVARQCGVSSMAVSLALSGKEGVSRKTAERILAVAKAMNYSPNLIAKSLRVNRTGTLGVVISDSSHLLIAKMLKTIGEVAEEQDYSIVMVNTDQNPEREKNAIHTLVTKRIDGLLLAAPKNVDDESVKEATDLGIPVAMLMRSGSGKIDTVTGDNFQGGRDIANYLIETGSSRIHMIALPKNSQSGKERLRGYRAALDEHGLSYNPGDVISSEPSIEAGYAAMAKFLAKGLRQGAVVCGCDVIAIGAMRAILRSGLRIPDDIRLCGYDDIELLDDLRVPLTTMRQPIQTMGREGINLLLGHIRDPKRAAVRLVLPIELVIRQST